MKRRFKIGDSVYEIPASEVSAFLKDNPGAIEVRSYNVEGKKYEIPVAEVSAFETDMGLKKKEPSSVFSGLWASNVPTPSGASSTELSTSVATETPEPEVAVAEPVESATQLGSLMRRGTATNTGRGVKAAPIERGVFEGIENLPDYVPPVAPVFKRVMDGYTAIFTKESLPEGYEKTDEGVRQYMADTGVKMFSSDPTVRKAAKEEVIVVSESRRLREDPNIARKFVSTTDKESINQILQSPVEEITEDTWLQLKKKRDESLKAQRQAFENNPDNYRIDNKSGRKIFNKEFTPDLAVYDILIEKVGGELQREVVATGETASVLSADTDSDFTAFTRSPAKAIEKAQSRFSVESLNNPFLTGLEALKYTDENEYNLYKQRLSEGKTLSSTVMAKLTRNGADIISARNLRDLTEKKIDLDTFATKEQAIGKALDDNVFKRPDILQKTVGSAIGEYRAEKNGAWGLLGEWSVSDKEIDEIPAEYFASKGIDINRPEVQAAIKAIKDNEGVLPFDNAVPKDGLAREIWRGGAQPVKGITNFFGNLGASDNERLLQRELEPIANYSGKRTEYFDKHYGMLADAFNGLGQFATQYLLMETGIGAASLLGAGAKTSQLIGQLAIPYLQSYDDYYKTALQQTDNQFAAKIYAFTNAGMEAVSERLFNNVEFGRQVIKNFSGIQVNAEKLAKIFDKKVFDEAAQQEFKDVVENGLKASIRTVAGGVKGLAAESFEEVPVALTNFITDAMVNPQSVEGRDVFGEMKDAFLSGMVSFSIPSILGVGGKFRQQFSNKGTQEDALMVAARNSSDVKDAILNLAEDGVLSPEETNHKLQVLNTAQAVLSNMPTYAAGQKMEEADQVKYLALSVQERFIKEENKKTDDEAVKSVNEKKVEDIVRQKAAILNKQVERAADIPLASDIPLKSNKEVEDEIAANVPEDKRADAASFVNEMIEGDLLPTMMRATAQEFPLSFLQGVADQAFGVIRNEAGERVPVADELKTPDVNSQYTETVVDYAKQLFPQAERTVKNEAKPEAVPVSESKGVLGDVESTAWTNEELLANLPLKRDEINNAPMMVTNPSDKFGNTETRYIPFSIIEKAQKNDKLGGQTAKQIADRGGYSDKELDRKYPNWRKEVAELNKSKSQSQKPKADEAKPEAVPVEGKENVKEIESHNTDIEKQKQKVVDGYIKEIDALKAEENAPTTLDKVNYHKENIPSDATLFSGKNNKTLNDEGRTKDLAIFDIQGNKAKVAYVGDVRNENWFDGVASIENPVTETINNKSKIITIEPGDAVKEDGKWVIQKPMKILFTDSYAALGDNRTRVDNSKKIKELEQQRDARIEELDKQKKSVLNPQKPKADEAKPEAVPVEGNGELIEVHHGSGENFKLADKHIYLTEDKSEAAIYAKNHLGKVYSYLINKDAIASEDYVRKTIKELALKDNEGNPVNGDEYNIHELIDQRFEDTAISPEGVQKLYDKIKKDGYGAIEFLDESIGGKKRHITSIVVIDTKSLKPKADEAKPVTEGPAVVMPSENIQPNIIPLTKQEGGQNAVQEPQPTEGLLRDEGVRREGGLQEVEQGNQPEVVAEESQPKEEVKKETAFSKKAREMAAKIKADGLSAALPDWAKADLPEGTQKAGFGGKGLDNAIAKALELVADAVDRGAEIAEAIKEGWAHLKDYYEKNTTSFDEKKVKRDFEINMKGMFDSSQQETVDAEPAEKKNFNFFKNREIPLTGEQAAYLSKETLEEGTGEQVTQPFDYDKQTLDNMLSAGQQWMTDAKRQFSDSPVQYAVELLRNLKPLRAMAKKAVAMVSLLNSIDLDLRYKDLTNGERDVLRGVRRNLELEIAKNAREGSLTLNAQRLIHKLYRGEYKFTQAMEGVVTETVQKKADEVVEKMKKQDEDISETVRAQKRKQKEPSPSKTAKEPKVKKEKKTSFYEKVMSGVSKENIDKLKKQIRDIANSLNCGKKK